MSDINQILARYRVVPTVSVDKLEQAVPVAQALVAGGIPIAEVLFRSGVAGAAIRRIVTDVPGMLVGAGTVLNVAQVDEAIDAGAQFVVSPGIDHAIVKHCHKQGVLVIPGVMTPTEITIAIDLGLRLLKFFPAEAIGGKTLLRAISAPFSQIDFIPTGGIGPENLSGYLESDCVLACGGSWMVRPDLVEAGRFEEIETLSRQSMSVVESLSR